MGSISSIISVCMYMYLCESEKGPEGDVRVTPTTLWEAKVKSVQQSSHSEVFPGSANSCVYPFTAFQTD